MSIDPDTLAEMVADQIDLVPTSATFRGQEISVRVGESPQSRAFTLISVGAVSQLEALMKRSDADPAPTAGELLTIGEGTVYKIVSVTPLLSPTSPAGYRLTVTLP